MASVLAESALPVLKKFAKQDSLVHQADTSPPEKFCEDGVICGPIKGTKEALGYALHVEDNLSVQSYTGRFRDRLADGQVWARNAKSGKQVEMFVTSINLRDRCLTRLQEYNSKPATESD